MSSSTLLRLSGISLILASLLFTLAELVPVLFRDLTSRATDQMSILVLSLSLFGKLLLFLGFPGLYARQAHRAGKLGLVGFVIIIVALAYDVVWFPRLEFILMQIAIFLEPPFPSALSPQLGSVISFLIGFVFLRVGLILFGIATLAFIQPCLAGKIGV